MAQNKDSVRHMYMNTYQPKTANRKDCKLMLKTVYIVKHVISKIQVKISIGLHHRAEKDLHIMECKFNKKLSIE